ncbi:MAG: nucleoside triphosphate hydrolase [Cyanobacteria bacterium TGS_CYA1]|nr:nucleoside triphosphate hydrolase [Cyanobacteria bacterium TGS_CYA1]
MSTLKDDLLEAWQAKGKDKRFILGIVGAPGAGKSTLASRLCAEINAEISGKPAIVVPMDGYHFSNEHLSEINLLALKGIPATFDSHAFVDTLARIKNTMDESVLCPRFDRSIEASIPDDIEVKPQHKLILVEGNYLLLDDSPWSQIASLLDQSWYIHCPADTLFARLIQRHVNGGKSRPQALEKVESTDLPNASLIETTKSRATRVLQ